MTDPREAVVVQVRVAKKFLDQFDERVAVIRADEPHQTISRVHVIRRAMAEFLRNPPPAAP